MAATIIAAIPARLRPEFFDDAAVAELEALANDIGRTNGDVAGSSAVQVGSPGGELVWLDSSAELARGSNGTGVWPHARILITAWGQQPLTAEVLNRLPALGLVAHTGATVRPFVTEDLFARKIVVTQAGQGMARSVAEVALTFTLGLLHQVQRFDHALRTGASWEHAEAAPPRHEILRSRIGVVGASRTGVSYVEVVQALGAEVLVYDPFLEEREARRLGVRRVELDELLQRSRIVALHAPSLPETRHMIGVRELALMPDGAGLVNTARSWLVDEAALVAELRTGRIDAGLDVFDDEPLPVDHPFRSLPNVMLTPHHAAGTVECRLRQGRIVMAEVERFLDGQGLDHRITERSLMQMA